MLLAYSVFIGILLISTAFLLLKEIYLSFKILKTSGRAEFIFVFLVYLISFYILFPGLVDGDTRFILMSTRENNYADFFGIFFSAIINLYDTLNILFYPAAICQIILAMFCFIKIIEITDVKNTQAQAFFIKTIRLIFFISPLTLGLVLYDSRDALIALALGSFFLYVYTKKSLESNRYPYLLLLIFFIICNLRQEAVVILFMAPALLYLFKIFSKKKALKMLVGIIILTSLNKTLISIFFKKPINDPVHILTAVLNPLGDILYKVDFKEFDKKDLENIDRIVSIECFKTNYDPLEIMPFHKGCVKQVLRNQTAFYLSVAKIFFNNFSILAENRINVFLNAANFKNKGYVTFSNDYHSFDWKKLLPASNTEEYKKALSSKYFTFLINSVRNQFDYIRIILFSLLSSFVVIFLCILGFTKDKLIKTALWLISTRAVVIFLLSPAAYFKYYHSLYFVCGLIGLLIVSRTLNANKLY